MANAQDPVDNATNIVLTASERDPREEKYGIILEDDSKDGYATHAALWFNSREEIAEYLTKSFAVLASTDKFKATIAELAQAVVADGLNEDLVAALNQCAVGAISIIWTGSLDELCRAEDEFPRMIVAMFREEDRQGRVPPVSKSEMENFVEFLADLKDRG